jgi:hypothetical protein
MILVTHTHGSQMFSVKSHFFKKNYWEHLSSSSNSTGLRFKLFGTSETNPSPSANAFIVT